MLILKVNGSVVAAEVTADARDSAAAMHDALYILMHGDDAAAMLQCHYFVLAACARFEEKGEVSCGAFLGAGACATLRDEAPVTLRCAS
jgi:hypothetical protein